MLVVLWKSTGAVNLGPSFSCLPSGYQDRARGLKDRAIGGV